MDTVKLRERFEQREVAARGLSITLLTLNDGYAQMRLPLTASLAQGEGIVMGGFVVTLADYAMPYAIMTMIGDDETSLTTEFSVKFIAPVVLEDEAILACATIMNDGTSPDSKRRLSRVVTVEVCVYSEQTGELKAKCLGTSKILPRTIIEKVIERTGAHKSS